MPMSPSQIGYNCSETDWVWEFCASGRHMGKSQSWHVASHQMGDDDVVHGFLTRKNEFRRKYLQFHFSQKNVIFTSDPLVPLNLDFCPGMCDSTLPSLRDLGECKLVLWKAALTVGLGSSFLSHFSVLFWYSEDIEEINKSLYTFYIMANTYCKTLLLPECFGCRAVRD